MGADLITFILVGPESLKLTRGRRQNILNRCEEVRDAATAVTNGDGSKKQKLLVEGLDEYARETLALCEPSKVLDYFLEVWNNAGPRDVNSRLFRPAPGKRMLKLLVAGDMSWGDEPEGAGYQAIKEAYLLGLFPRLGIQ